MIFRSPEAKRDLAGSWQRPDRPFFAAGACHILAGVFLETYEEAGWEALLILPEQNFRGSHVVVTDGESVFDYHGYTRRDRYLGHYQEKMRRFFPGWNCLLTKLDSSPVGKNFCRQYDHRQPDEFLHDPRPRARAYLRRFPTPDPILRRS